MIAFTCCSCQKKLSVMDDLAGKKGKCPGCGQIMVIPIQVAVPLSVDEMRTRPSSLGAEPADKDQMMRPPQLESNGALTHPPSSDPYATKGDGKPGVFFDTSLTYFLAPSQADDELGRLGKYRILQILGHGGMGVVFKAEDPGLKRMVAIKAMLPMLAASPCAGQRFRREAQAMAAIKHDHIVTIHQVDEERGVPFLAMEFLAGEPLDKRLKRSEKLPLGEVLRIGREIAQALGAAHATGLIHRDVKPANIWVEAPRGRVKILDFGLARSASKDAGLTQQGAILGTPAFMSPEQARGDAVDARSDLFSLGVVLYRMCTGQQPFKGNDITSTLLAIGSHQPPPPIQLNAEIPRELSVLVMKVLEKDPERRPASAGDVAEALETLELQAKKSAPTGMVPVAAPASPDLPTHALAASDAKVSDNTVWVESNPAPKPLAKARRRRTALLVAIGLFAVVALGWWLATIILRMETANGTLIVEITDNEVEARIKNGKLILLGPDDKVRYTLEPSDRDKKIEAGPYKIRVEGADGLVLDTPEFTLKKDGKVKVRVTVDPKAVAKNPDPDRKAAEYVLSIGGTVQVKDENLEIKAAADLPKEAFQLSSVNLRTNKQVSDRGLANFKECKNLTHLDLAGTQVSDTGLANFKDCKNLTALLLYSTQVSDAGLANFKDCKSLTHLHLMATQASDAGLANFKDCKNLRSLDLSWTQVSDAGLANFKECKNLTALLLYSTQVSDAGLANFKDCKTLGDLHLAGTQVSDAGLANFKDCKSLGILDLRDTQVSDTGLAHFKDCTKLGQVLLSGTKVSDASMPLLKDCNNLLLLELARTKVTDAGLTHLKDCKNLAGLCLDGTQVTDVGLAHLKDCKNLTNLLLRDTQVSDVGLVQLKDCKDLKDLHLEKTKVTAKGIDELKKALPKCKIEWDGGVIEPKEK